MLGNFFYAFYYLTGKEIFFGPGNAVALFAIVCPYSPQYKVDLIYSSSDNKDSRNTDNGGDDDDDDSSNNNFQL